MNDARALKPVFLEGFWTQNTGLVVLLGLCPLLAVTTTVVNGIGLGLATILTLVISGVSVSLARPLLRPEIRIPIFVLVIACVVTVIQMLMQAYWIELYHVLGIFIPLIVTNCAIIGRAEAFASRNRPLAAAIDGLATGLGFTMALVLLGAVRELTGRGTLFVDAQMLVGDWGRHLSMTVINDYPGFLLAVMPPGAFMCLGLLIAGRNWLSERLETRQRSTASEGITNETE